MPTLTSSFPISPESPRSGFLKGWSMGDVRLLSGRHALAVQSGWNGASSTHVSTLARPLAALVTGRRANRLQRFCNRYRSELGDLPDFKQWRHATAKPDATTGIFPFSKTSS